MNKAINQTEPKPFVKRGVRQTTINKLCVALTELSTKIKTDRANTNLRETFNAYCKRYKINYNLWYSLIRLGHIEKAENGKGFKFKIKRHEINLSMANAIISDNNDRQNEYRQSLKNLLGKKEKPIDNTPESQEPSESKEENEKENELYIVFDHNHRFSRNSTVFDSLEEVKKIQCVGSYHVFKLVGSLNVVAQATLHTDIKAEIKQAKPFDYEYGNDKKN